MVSYKLYCFSLLRPLVSFNVKMNRRPPRKQSPEKRKKVYSLPNPSRKILLEVVDKNKTQPQSTMLATEFAVSVAIEAT